jgi:hypothetical protein
MTSPVPFYAGSAITAQALDGLAVQFAVSAGQSIASTTPAAVSGFSFPVVVGTYIARAHLVIDANSGGTAEFRWTGPTASLVLLSLECQPTATLDGYQVANTSNGTGYNTGFIDSQLFSTAFYVCNLEAVLTFTAAGTLALEAANLAGASDTWEIYAGSYMSVILQQT